MNHVAEPAIPRLRLIALVTLLAGGPIVVARQDVQKPAVDIDHVILGINDLERGVQQFAARTGVTPARGGEHPGRGTQNALASLGAGRYLEIIAPAGAGPSGAPGSPRVDFEELTPTGWALQARDIGDVVARLRAGGITTADPRPGSRRTPDGALLEWQVTAGMEPGLELAPFFIEWGQRTTHPSVSSPAGCTLVSVELTHPQPERLRAFFAAAGYPAAVASAERPGMRLTLDCPRGKVDFANTPGHR